MSGEVLQSGEDRAERGLIPYKMVSIEHIRGAMGNTAKVFMTGRSQAVRLPKEFRFKSNEVRIREEGNAVILEPLVKDWSWLDNIARPIDQDFLDAVAERPDDQSRPELDGMSKKERARTNRPFAASARR